MRRPTAVALGLLALAVLGRGLYEARRRSPPARGAQPRLVRLEPPNPGAELLGDGAAMKLRAIATDVPSTLSWRVLVPEGARLETHLSFARSEPLALEPLTCRARIEAGKGLRDTHVLLERELAYGYPRPTSPHIDRLARRGLCFENAETVQSATWPALTSLHTSLYPSAHGVVWNGRRLPEGLTTLAEILHSNEYSTSAFITNMTRGRHPGFSRLFLSRDGGQVEADRHVVDQALGQLRLERERRFFMWVHLLSPHADYDPPPPPLATAFTRPGASAVKAEIDALASLRRRNEALTERDVAHVIGLYDGEVSYVDSLVGQLLGGLQELGLERSTLVVLTADHGEDLYEHNRYFFHSPSIYGSSMRVPLVLALPGVLPEGGVTDHPASLIDLAPTILGLLALPAPAQFQGENLLPGRGLPSHPVRKHTFGETNGRIYSVRSAEWRFVYNPERLYSAAPGGPYLIGEEELFDLRKDPRERHNLARARPDLARVFRTEIRAWKTRYVRKAAQKDSIDPEELRALGYLAN